MIYTVTITSQGQISLPVKIRRKLGLSNIRKAFVRMERGTIIVEPVADMLSLKGSVKSTRKIQTDTIRHAFEKELAREVVTTKRA